MSEWPMMTLGRSLIGLGMMLALTSAAGAQGKTLVFCSEGPPENFTPALNTTGTSFDAARPVYDQLVQFARGSTKIEAGLAEKWAVSKDGLEVVFNLRKGVKFHTVDGFKPTRDFNADDVLWSFNRQWRADHPFHGVSEARYDFFADMDMPRLLKSIEKIDDYTVKFTLTEPNAPIIANLAMDFASIHSAEYAAHLAREGKPELFDQIPVGTGPFSFLSYEKDTTIRFAANPAYWGEKARVDTLVYHITRDPTARFAKLKAGECHFIAAPRPADLAEMQKDKSLKVISQAGLNIAYLAFNVQKKPFSDRRVRYAFNMAIDKKSIIRDVYLGAGQMAKNLIPPILWSHNAAIEDFPYDPEQAKELLKEAGVAMPLEIDLWYMPVQRPYNPNARRVAEMMQADLAKVGINAKLVTFEWADYRRRVQQGEHALAQLGWTGDNADPDNFFFLRGCTSARPGGQNITKWCHKEYDDLLNQARKLSDSAERTKIYEKMQRIEREEAPDLKLAHSIVYEAMRVEVEGFKQSPLGAHKFNGVSLK